MSTLSSSFVLGLLTLLAADCSLSADDWQPEHVGWQGHYHLGEWAPVHLQAFPEAQRATEVRIGVPDAEGHTVVYTTPLSPNQEPSPDAPQAPSQKQGWFRCGRLPGTVKIEFYEGEKLLRAISLRAGGEFDWPDPLPLQRQLIVTVGQPAGFNSETLAGDGYEVVTTQSVADLVPDERAYEAVSWLVINGPQDGFSPKTVAALETWVRLGGRMILALDSQSAQLSDHPLLKWMPFTVKPTPVEAVEVGSLEYFAGRNTRIPTQRRMTIPKINSEAGLTLAKSLDDPLLVRLPYGFGEVQVLAFDLTQSPLTRWVGLPDLARKMVSAKSPGAVEPTRSVNTQIATTGVSDISTQLNATVSHFPKVHRVTPWPVLGILLLYLLVIGPLDFFVLQRWWKRPLWAWVSLPLIVVGSSTLLVWGAVQTNGTNFRANSFRLIDYDVATNTERVNQWWTVYVPRTGQYGLKLAASDLTESAAKPVSSVWDWFGVPETGFGGMYQPVGVELGLGTYQHPEKARELQNVPLLQWSAKTLRGSQFSVVSDQVEAPLTSNSLGRLSGTITHHLNGTLEDWVLTYANRVYAIGGDELGAATPPWKPGEPLNLDGPNIIQRELRALLTRTVSSQARRAGQAQLDVVFNREDYAPLSRDPLSIARMVTFHEEAGGQSYTSLTNRLLDSEDLSRQLQLGRVVLFGRFVEDAPPPDTLEVDGVPLAPDRADVFVRLVLPVNKTAEIPRFLPKLIE